MTFAPTVEDTFQMPYLVDPGVLLLRLQRVAVLACELAKHEVLFQGLQVGQRTLEVGALQSPPFAR